jgi:hypothetical protein
MRLFMARSLTLTWLGLVALTLTGWWLGHQPGSNVVQQAWLPWAVLLLSAIKGQWVIDHFMGMKTAPTGFRMAVSGWLVTVLCTIALLL